jgi:nitrite reductase (NADH) large subunit
LSGPGAEAIRMDPVLVVGGGPAGMRAAQELAGRGLPVTLFNAERWAPYNRVKLTPFLAGEVQISQVYQPADSVLDPKVRRYTDQRIVRVDRDAHAVIGQAGRRWHYSKLVLAVGSRPFVPNIPGIDLAGVFTFRMLDDVEKLVARALRSRRAVVIGGGLLGLEVARGMASRGVNTWVVENASRLMAAQLDEDAGRRLAGEVERLGISVRTGVGIREITGRDRVERLTLRNGETVPCDTVIVCTGIRSNIELARDARLAVGRGITVNERMQTSDPDIYAIGECAEYDGHVYGLVSPGLEQAAAAAAHIAGDDRPYTASPPTTKLKVVGIDVCSVGQVEQIDQRLDLRSPSWSDAETGAYRRLVFDRGRLVGALGIGPWPGFNRIQQAVQARRRIGLWQRRRFRHAGDLWAEAVPASVLAWPEAATVCNCTGVTRGQLGRAVAQGADSIEALRRMTSASTVCGTCQPLLAELLDVKAVREPVGWARGLVWVSALALLTVMIAALVPAWPYTTSVQTVPRIDVAWIDGVWKQVSGFTLLGLSMVAAALSLRKRTRRRLLGSFDGWRAFHAAVGLALLGVLFAHTGFNLGHNLNFWLMASFLAITLLGAVAGAMTAIEHRIDDGVLKRFRTPPRRITTWLHLIAAWPLPMLLLVHILTVYFY